MGQNGPTVAIIGAGHNGLTCAAYLSQAGFAVSLFEKRETLGGLCVSERPFKQAPDIKVSSVASYFGMLRGEVMQELALEEHGLKPYLTNPIEIVLMDKGQYVFTPRDGQEENTRVENTRVANTAVARTRVEGLDEKQKEGWQNFWADIQKAAAIVYPHYLKPGLTQSKLVELLKEAGLDNLADKVFAGSLFDLLSDYVSNDSLKAVAATCTPGFASNVGSVFGCIHHGTASTCGEFGAWGQVFGGMGEITAALTDVALQNGARVHVDADVKSLCIDSEEEEEDCKVSALTFADGSSEKFDIVVCAIDPYILFEKLLPARAGQQDSDRSRTIQDHLAAHRPKVSAAKIHLLLKSLPGFKTLTDIGHNHKGVIVIAPDREAVERAATAVPAGNMPDRLMLTMAFPSLEDPSMLGSNEDEDTNTDRRHVLTVDVHYLPALIQGKPWTESDDQVLLEATIKTIEDQCPDIRKYILESFVVSPRALAERYNLSSLSCWHLPMTPEHLFEKRSLPGCDHYETPFSNLYLCSAGTYPGGNVTAAPGHNLAKLLITRYGDNDKRSGITATQAQTISR